MNAITRRSILCSTAAAALAAPAAAAPLSALVAEPTEPLVVLGKAERAAYRKYAAALDARDDAQGEFRDRYGEFPTRGDPRMESALYVAEDDAEEAWERSIQAIVDTPATGLAGLFVKLRQVAYNGEDSGAVFASALADAERMVGGVA